MVVYIIVGMVVALSIVGGFTWAVFAVKKRKKVELESSKQRLLNHMVEEEEVEEETIDNIMHKKRKSSFFIFPNHLLRSNMLNKKLFTWE